MMKAGFNTQSRPKDRRLSLLIDVIIDERPDLAGETFYVPESGKSAYTLIVGGEVFKAPKHKDDIPDFEREFRIHETLSGAGVAHIAPISYVGKKACFYAIRKIDGVAPDLRLRYDMTPEQRKAFPYSLGQTLARASLAFDEWDDAYRTIPCDSFIEGLRLWQDKGLKDFFRTRAPALAEALDNYLWRYDLRPPSLVHRDLHSGNMLVDPETKSFAALLDLGRARFSRTPEVEFIRLCTNTDHYEAHYDTDFARAAFAGYCKTMGGMYRESDLLCYSAVQLIGCYLRSPAVTERDVEFLLRVIEETREHLKIVLTPAKSSISRADNTPK